MRALPRLGRPPRAALPIWMEFMAAATQSSRCETSRCRRASCSRVDRKTGLLAEGDGEDSVFRPIAPAPSPPSVRAAERSAESQRMLRMILSERSDETPPQGAAQAADRRAAAPEGGEPRDAQPAHRRRRAPAREHPQRSSWRGRRARPPEVAASAYEASPARAERARARSDAALGAPARCSRRARMRHCAGSRRATDSRRRRRSRAPTGARSRRCWRALRTAPPRRPRALAAAQPRAGSIAARRGGSRAASHAARRRSAAPRSAALLGRLTQELRTRCAIRSFVKTFLQLLPERSDDGIHALLRWQAKLVHCTCSS